MAAENLANGTWNRDPSRKMRTKMTINFDLIGKKFDPYIKKYDWKDVILYAVGVGAGFDELEYVYERDLKVIPSFGVVATVHKQMLMDVEKLGHDPAGNLHWSNELIIHRPIPLAATWHTEAAVTQVYDRGPDKGCQIVEEFTTCDERGTKLFTNISTNLARFDGGFGGQKMPAEILEYPDRSPDFEVEDCPARNQPLIYRLSDDIFPLHVDPEFARGSGFRMPIMHGLCTAGFACRALVKSLFPGEPERLTRFKLRFTSTLYPGIPIKTLIWKIKEGQAYFKVMNMESGEPVLNYSVVEWR
jgi:acyl dehydratase